MFANTTFITQYPNRIMKSRLNSDTSSASDVINLSPEPASVYDAEPIKLARRSDANVP